MKIKSILSSSIAVVAALVFLGMPTYAQQQSSTSTASISTPTALVAGTPTATVNGNSKITVATTAPTGGTAPYQYSFGISSDNVTWAWSLYDVATSHVMSGLNASSTYYLAVKYQDAGGQVVQSTTITATTAATLNSGTLVTSNVQATSLTLTASGVSGGLTPYTYTFYQAPDNAGSPGTWTVLGGPQASNTYNVTGLTANTKYWFKVVVTDSGN